MVNERKVIKIDPEDVKAIEEKQKASANPLHLLINQQGRIKPNIYNAKRIIEGQPPFKGLFAFNKRSQQIDVTKDVPKLNLKKGKFIPDLYYGSIENVIESIFRTGGLTLPENMLTAAIQAVAQENSYDPIQDFIKSAYNEWDGKERLTNLLPTYLGADQTDLTAYITKLWFAGSAAKAYDPYTIFDLSLDLIGDQGVGKTTFARKIAPLGYYTDQFKDVTNKDDLFVLCSSFIANDDEMVASKNASSREWKKFRSMKEIEARPPYGRTSIKLPLAFTMIRTTNEIYYLNDYTGTRRYLPVHCHLNQQQEHPNAISSLTHDEVKQIWGEAAHLYIDGTIKLNPDQEHQQQLNRNCQKFMSSLPVDDELAEYVNSHPDMKFISNSDIRTFITLKGINYNRNSKRIAELMQKYGYQKGRSSDGNQRGFKKSDNF